MGSRTRTARRVRRERAAPRAGSRHRGRRHRGRRVRALGRARAYGGPGRWARWSADGRGVYNAWHRGEVAMFAPRLRATKKSGARYGANAARSSCRARRPRALHAHAPHRTETMSAFTLSSSAALGSVKVRIATRVSPSGPAPPRRSRPRHHRHRAFSSAFAGRRRPSPARPGDALASPARRGRPRDARAGLAHHVVHARESDVGVERVRGEPRVVQAPGARRVEVSAEAFPRVGRLRRGIRVEGELESHERVRRVRGAARGVRRAVAGDAVAPKRRAAAGGDVRERHRARRTARRRRCRFILRPI